MLGLTCARFLSYLNTLNAKKGSTIEKSGNSYSIIGIGFCNQGTINVKEGQLQAAINASCSDASASAAILSGAQLVLQSSTVNFPITAHSGGQCGLTDCTFTTGGRLLGSGQIRLMGTNVLGNTVANTLELTNFDTFGPAVTTLPDPFSLSSTGKLNGKGTFISGSVIIVDGQVTPGASPGILTINPSVSSTSAAIYDMEIIGGYGASGIADDADQLASSGNIGLAGTLHIILNNPDVGDRTSVV